MEESPWKKNAGSFVGIGLGLFLLAWILVDVFPDAGRFGMLLGGAMTLGGLAVRWQAVVGWLKVYWLVLTFAAIVVFAVLLSPETVDSLTAGGKLHPWIVRFLLVVLLQGVALAVWSTLRDKGSFQAKRAGVAANVTILIEVGLALLIFANWVGSNHLTRWIGSYDATEMKVYSLGDRTLSLLDSLADLPAPVHAVYLDFGSTYRSRGGPALGPRGKDFLEQYDDASPNVIVRDFDALKDLTDAEAYLRDLGAEDLQFGSEDTVVFLYRDPDSKEPNRKDVTVRSWDFIGTSELGTQQFKGEQIYTSAIQEVVLPKKKVYALTGHGEHPLAGSDPDSLKEAAELVRKLSLTVETLNLAEAGVVPEDADLLWIAGPKAPLLEDERETIVAWLEEGGSLLLMLDPQSTLLDRGTARWTTGLEEFLGGLGLAVKTDFICMDYEYLPMRAGAAMAKTPVITTADYSFHEIVSDLEGREFPCIFFQASPVSVEVPEDAKDLTAEELVYVRRSPAEYPTLQTYAAKLVPGREIRLEREGDLLGQRLAVGAAAERRPTGEDEGESVSTRVVVFGDSDFATSMGLSTRGRYFAAGHATLLTNSVSWALGREELISIEPKTLESERVTLKEEERKLARTVALYALPAFVLFLAIGTAWRRRR